MSQKHFLLKGTFILTVVGILTRVMGFFYRIFLSRSFPAEEIGLYQLIFPVYTLAYAATSAGIETALARLVAASSAKKQSAKAYSYLKAALLCSLFLSICCLFLLQKNAVFLTTVILGDPRLSHLPDSICTSICSSAQLQLWLLSGAQADPASCPLPII